MKIWIPGFDTRNDVEWDFRNDILLVIMFYIFVGVFLFFAQTFLQLSADVNVWPELSFFPWLVQKGLIPYRDFFDHHGFLLYYLLAPLTSNQSLLGWKILFFFIESVNLLLVLLILKKITSKKGFIIGGITYISINFFTVQNNLWYEVIITTVYLSACYLLIVKEFKYKDYMIGFLIALSSFIKPLAAILLIPVLYFRRKFSILLTLIISWIVAISYFIINKAGFDLFNGLFFYNLHLSKKLPLPKLENEKFIISSLVIFLFSVIFICRNKYSKHNLLIFLFFLSTLIFLRTGFYYEHLVPLVPFFALLISLIFLLKSSFYRNLFLTVFLIYLIFAIRKGVYHYYYLTKERIVYQKNQTSRDVINDLKMYNNNNDKFFIFSYNLDVYSNLDQLPPTKYPMIFMYMRSFIPDFEEKLISELEENKVKYIVFGKAIINDSVKLPKVEEYMKSKFRLVKDRKNFQIYSK